MLPGSVRRHVAERLDTVAATAQFRVLVSTLLVVMHLVLFTVAGHEKLGEPFNNAPGNAPYFSDPDAPSLRPVLRQPHYWSRLIVSRWDSQHYISFALRGTTACPTDPSAEDYEYMQCGLAWLPGWGLTAGTLVDATGMPADFALLFLSLIAALALNILWTSPLIVAKFGRFETYMTLIAFNVFPSAFYIVTPYTESATMALAIGAYLCLLRDRWGWAGFLVGASTALRAGAMTFAFGLCFAALVAAYFRYREGAPRWWRPLVGGALSGWGIALTMLMFKIFLNEPFAYKRARDAFGDESHPFRMFDPEFYLRAFSSQHIDGVMMIGGIAIVVLMWKHLRARMQREELAYFGIASLLSLLLPVVMLQTDQYWGINRYLLLAPLIFFAAGQMAREHKALFVFWLLLCGAIYWNIELCSYISHGNPGTCPCMGRLEFTLPYQSQ
jgi:hypothetical protein